MPSLLSSTRICVVIPAFKEESLHLTLDSLQRCLPPICTVDVLIINNLPIDSDVDLIESQKILSSQVLQSLNPSSFLSFFVLEVYDLPKDNFGAGLARKIGMDIAANRFYEAERYDGIILSLDADCLVKDNYFVAVESYFSHVKNMGASIYFEHPLLGDLPAANYLAILQYELHLRYYNLMLKYCGFPNAFQTVGSSFAVRANAYVMAGGMSKKIAGEDFYFIQKLLPIGGYGDILTTTVYPSARLSSRVLFGTGAAITKFVNEEATQFYTFNVEAFLCLKSLFQMVDILYATPVEQWDSIFASLGKSLLDFFEFSKTPLQIEKLKQNCSSLKVFQKRFFSIFDGLLIVRYLNFAHDKYFEKIPVSEAARQYLTLCQISLPSSNDLDMLNELRRVELNNGVR